MNFIKENDRLAFKYKDEIIYIDEFLDVDTKDSQVKDKDGKKLYESSISFPTAHVNQDKEPVINYFISKYCGQKIQLRYESPMDYIDGIGNIMLSNYLDKIIKLFKVYLRERCIDDIKRVKKEQDVAKYIEKFKNDIKLLDGALEESAAIKENYKNFQNYKSKEITEIENLF